MAQARPISCQALRAQKHTKKGKRTNKQKKGPLPTLADCEMSLWAWHQVRNTRKQGGSSLAQSHNAFGFFFLSGWKMEDALAFFFSFKLSSSAVELESVEFSSSTTAPEKFPFRAATKMLPAFLRLSMDDIDVSGGRGRSSGSEVVVGPALSGVVGEDGSVCTMSSVDVRIRRGGASSALTALFSSWLLFGRTSCGGSGGLPKKRETRQFGLKHQCTALHFKREQKSHKRTRNEKEQVRVA